MEIFLTVRIRGVSYQACNVDKGDFELLIRSSLPSNARITSMYHSGQRRTPGLCAFQASAQPTESCVLYLISSFLSSPHNLIALLWRDTDFFLTLSLKVIMQD